MGKLDALYERFEGQVAFFVVYIKEAHPEDGWVLSMNREAGVAATDPATGEERAGLAQTCALRMNVRMPVLIDSITNRVARAYGAWPDRLYLVGFDGRIAWQGAPGPLGFKPDELEEAIDTELRRS